MCFSIATVFSCYASYVISYFFDISDGAVYLFFHIIINGHVMMDKPVSYYAFEMLYWTGIRCGELLALTPKDINFERQELTIWFFFRAFILFHYICHDIFKNSTIAFWFDMHTFDGVLGF